MTTGRSDRAAGSDDAEQVGGDRPDRASPSAGGEAARRVKRPAARVGRPPLGARAKQQVTMRLDPDVIAWFRATGPGWQGRINAALRAAAGI